VVPLDALRVINQLIAPTLLDPQGRLPPRAAESTLAFFDVNGDGFCTPIDALQVINFLIGLLGESESEGTASAAEPSVIVANPPPTAWRPETESRRKPPAALAVPRPALGAASRLSQTTPVGQTVRSLEQLLESLDWRPNDPLESILDQIV
jgi:hypothetical protein